MILVKVRSIYESNYLYVCEWPEYTHGLGDDLGNKYVQIRQCNSELDSTTYKGSIMALPVLLKVRVPFFSLYD